LDVEGWSNGLAWTICLAYISVVQGIDPEEVNMRIEKTFTRMSAAFLNADKAEESFVCLNELKDSGVFDLLLQLLHEPAFLHAKTLRVSQLNEL